jgi:glycine/D-amino acid oxidase-like deaminating enzyme
MSDTPRTDAARPPYTELQEFVSAEFARQLERELNAANERINRLEQAGGIALAYAEKGDYETANKAWLLAKEAHP